MDYRDQKWSQANDVGIAYRICWWGRCRQFEEERIQAYPASVTELVMMYFWMK